MLFERRTERRPEREKGSFTCSCGHVLARSKGFVVPIFAPLKSSSAARAMPALETFTIEELTELFQEINERIGESSNKQ
jgi:hypothetical protein